MEDRYRYDASDFATLLLRKFYPERTDRESGVIRDYLQAHLHDFDRVSFSVRIGTGQQPDPTHLEGVQQNTAYSSKKRIDILGYFGKQPTIVEVKERITPAALGQILAYRHLFLEEFPDAPEPLLVIVGRYSDDDTIRVLQAHGITVYTYTPIDSTSEPPGGSV